MTCAIRSRLLQHRHAPRYILWRTVESNKHTMVILEANPCANVAPLDKAETHESSEYFVDDQRVLGAPKGTEI